jgi:hypothetical protein
MFINGKNEFECFKRSALFVYQMSSSDTEGLKFEIFGKSISLTILKIHATMTNIVIL